MKENETQPEPTASLPAATAKARLLGITEWFWRGELLARARAALPEPSERAAVLARRARQCVDLAGELLLPIEDGEPLPRASASELYRQAAYWTLCAIAATSGGVVPGDYEETTWDALDQATLARVASGAERVDTLSNILRHGSFVHVEELPPEEQRQIVAELRALVELLSARFYARERSLQALYSQRAGRLGLALLVGLLAVVVVVVVRWPKDLAAGKPWRASTILPQYGCDSPAQQCDRSPGFFFCTDQSKDPWIEFDLGAEHAVSLVKIENRTDCCFDRPVPLTVDVSTDHQHWKSVARRDEVFAEWDASFSSVPAQWVRLRVHKDTVFHLNRVRIYR